MLSSAADQIEYWIYVNCFAYVPLIFASNVPFQGRCLGLTFLNTGSVAVCGEMFLVYWRFVFIRCRSNNDSPTLLQ
jgi:hypothetical protein